jgi:DNA-binding CsgD family transcriptional regulator
MSMPDLGRAVPRSVGGPLSTSPAGVRLTPREWECLRLIASGYSAWQTGALLDIHESTVKNHLLHARQRAQVHSAIDLLRAVGWLVVPQ